MVFDLVLVVGLAAACLTTTLIYGLGSPFWRHITGIGLFTILAACTVITSLSALQLVGIFNHDAARAAYLLAIAAVVTMGVIIRREQILGKRRERAKQQTRR